MNKSDKELATEILVAYIAAWSGPGRLPPKQAELPALIELVYETVKGLN